MIKANRCLCRITAATYHPRALVALVALAVIAAVTVPRTAFAGTSDADQIRQVAYGSQLGQQQLDVPTSPQPAGHGLAPGVVQDMQGQIGTQLAQYYSGQRLQQVTTIMQQHVADQSNGIITELGGGVDSIRFDSITIQGQQAAVSGQAVKWLKLAWRAQNGAISVVEPRGPVNFVDQLVNTGAGWRITSETLSFPPGTGP